jgi:hypothetical protein
MEGKGIVSVTLPVKIFDKKTILMKVCDLWCTAPKYLTEAAL